MEHMVSEETIFSVFFSIYLFIYFILFIFFFLAFWFPWQPIKMSSRPKVI